MGDPPPNWENMKCAILFMRSRNGVHTTPFISLIVFCFDLTSTSHVHLLEAGIRIPGIS
jgi:hypothetical protein